MKKSKVLHIKPSDPIPNGRGQNYDKIILDEVVSAEQLVDLKLPRTHDDLLKALYWAFDMFERASMPYFLAYKTAEDVKDRKQLEGEAVHVGVRVNEWASGARRIPEPFTMVTENKAEFVATGGVPVILHILKDDECIRVPDTIIYESEAFHLPNPYSRFVELYG